MAKATPIAEAAARCVEILRRRPSALLTDIDGTISPIAPTPDAAVVSESARVALARILVHVDIAGAVSGRSAENAEVMVGVPGLTYFGNHGMEYRRDGEATYVVDQVASSAAVKQALAEIHERALSIGLDAGILYEDKGVTGSVHYRLAPDPDTAVQALMPIATAATERAGLRVTEGRMVIELRPRVPVNKGTTVTHLIDSAGIRGILFFGDDLTDLDGFRAVEAARSHGRVAGLNIAVASVESSPVVAEAADVVVAGVDNCVHLLERIADLLDAEA